MSAVYIISKSGKSLMPTTRYGHVRHLLKEGKAEIYSRNPFTVNLLKSNSLGSLMAHMIKSVLAQSN